ncbi:unnamed protein product [Dicrocoelium dendriticum]|nr:unnamed protein product [Dicrocoelium dendriticum]
MPAPTISNAVDGLENGEDIEKLKKLLPHVNLETGLKHRSVTRDPITGLGAKSVDEVEGRIRSRSHSSTGRAYNHTFISWNIDSDAAATKLAQCKRKNARNPITMTGDLGDEVDKFRSTNRPRGATLREPQRNPISGQGNFGEREWDPVWKYNGKIRRSKSSTNIRSNPLTGQNVKSFEVMFEEKPRASKRHEEKNKPQRNALTGANCTSYSVPPGMKETHTSQHSPIQRNAITGEHCSTYDINAEVRCQKKRPNSNCTNPISGENMKTFVMSQEERQRPNKPYVYKNTVTGENLTSYQITPIERHVKPRQSTGTLLVSVYS